MAIRGVNLVEKEEYIHPDDPGHPDHEDRIAAEKAGKTPEEPTIYYIGNLTANDRVEFGDMSATPTMRDGGITMALRNVQKAYAVVQRGLKGWKNMQDSNGKIVEFKTSTVRSGSGGFVEAVSDDCMVHLPQSVILDLSIEIQRKNGMTNALAKKFEEPSLPSDVLSSVTGLAATDAPSSSEKKEDA